MPAWIPRPGLGASTRKLQEVLRVLGLQSHFITSFVAPEVIVFNISWPAVHECVLTWKSVGRNGLHQGQVGLLAGHWLVAASVGCAF